MSRMTKKRAAVLTAAAGALVLTACSSGSGGETEGEVGGEIAYSFWGSPERAEKVDAVIDQFEAANEGATVQPEVADYLAYVERLTVRAAGGDLACATGMQSIFMPQYAGNDVLLPLEDVIAAGQISTDGIPEDVMAAGQLDGVQYMIPTGIFVRIIGYNQALLDASGADQPTSDMTWEDYAAWLADVQAGLPDGVHAGENEGGILFTFFSWVIGHGGTMFEDGEVAFTEETVAGFFQYWIDLADAGVVVPATSIPDQNGALELTPIATGDAVAGTRDIPHLYIMEQALEGAGMPAEVNWVSVPSQDPEQSANVLGANGISIASECDNVATAAAFIDHFANDPDAALAFQSDNGILTNLDAQEALLADPDTPEGVKRNVTILRELTDSGDLTTTTYPSGLGTMTAELLRLYQAAAFGEMSVEDAAAAFVTSSQDALD